MILYIIYINKYRTLKDKMNPFFTKKSRLNIMITTEEKSQSQSLKNDELDKNDIIYNMHQYVLSQLNEEVYFKKIEILEENLKTCNSISVYNLTNQEILKNKKEIESVKNLKKKYIEMSKKMLDEYKNIYNKPVSINDTEKNKHIYNFYKMANIFVKIPYIKPNIQKKTCINCNSDISNYEFKKYSYICKICGLEEISYINTIDFTEDNKQTPEKDKETFTKALLKFQGKNNEDIPNIILQKLYEYCDNYGTNYIDVKKQDMYCMLQELGYPNYYEDINLILFKFNKTPLPDLSSYEEQLKVNYMLGENIYEKIKTDRKSSLNIQYLLFKHLEKLKYPCNKDDFKIIETREILIGYDQIWKQICDKLDWEFIPTI